MYRIKKLNEHKESIIDIKARETWNNDNFDEMMYDCLKHYGKNGDIITGSYTHVWKDGFENGFIECAKVFDIEHIVDNIEKYNL